MIWICLAVSTLSPAACAHGEQADGLPRTAHLDAYHTEQAAIEPRAAAQAGDVPGAVRVVCYQERLGRGDLRAVHPRREPCSALALQQAREQVQRRVQLVAAIGGVSTTSA